MSYAYQPPPRSSYYTQRSPVYVRKLEADREALLEAAKTALDEWIIGSQRERIAYDLLNDAINKAEGRE